MSFVCHPCRHGDHANGLCHEDRKGRLRCVCECVTVERRDDVIYLSERR